MGETKYGKHILKDVVKKTEGDFTGYSVMAHEGELNVDCSMGYHCIFEPIEFDRPHAMSSPNSSASLVAIQRTFVTWKQKWRYAWAKNRKSISLILPPSCPSRRA